MDLERSQPSVVQQSPVKRREEILSHHRRHTFRRFFDTRRSFHAKRLGVREIVDLIHPPLGREKARVFTLNLRNRLIFKAADQEGAMETADFLGKKRVIKKSWGYTGGRMS
jgi:hypothetical protein